MEIGYNNHIEEMRRDGDKTFTTIKRGDEKKWSVVASN